MWGTYVIQTRTSFESGWGSNSLANRHKPALPRPRTNSHPTDRSPLLRTGPVLPLETFQNTLPSAAKASQSPAPLSATSHSASSSIFTMQFKASIILGTCSVGIGKEGWVGCPHKFPNGFWLHYRPLVSSPQAFWLLGPNPSNHGCLGLSRKTRLYPLSPIPYLPSLLSLGFPAAEVAKGQGQGNGTINPPYPHT